MQAHHIDFDDLTRFGSGGEYQAILKGGKQTLAKGGWEKTREQAVESLKAVIDTRMKEDEKRMAEEAKAASDATASAAEV